jgi:hypothetical protein
MGSEADSDVEAAFGPCIGCERGAVDADDGADDGQPEPRPAGADSLGAQSLEWLEEAVDLIGRDERASVADGQDCPPVGDGGGDVDPASVDIVPDGVAEQVRDQALGQGRVAGGGRG